MNLHNLDTKQLTEREQQQLFPFYDAWRPFTPIPTRAECKAAGKGNYFPKVSTLDEVKEQARTLDCMFYGFLETVTRDEFGNVMDDPEEL